MNTSSVKRITQTTEPTQVLPYGEFSKDKTYCGSTAKYKHVAKTFLWLNKGKAMPILEVYKGILDAAVLVRRFLARTSTKFEVTIFRFVIWSLSVYPTAVLHTLV